MSVIQNTLGYFLTPGLHFYNDITAAILPKSYDKIRNILKESGIILITIVDSDFYNNIFLFDALSQELGMQKPIKYKFDPEDYPGYEHTMTHQEESGIKGYSKFATWEFRL